MNDRWPWCLVSCALGILDGVKSDLADMHGRNSTRCYTMVKQAQKLLDEAVWIAFKNRLDTEPPKEDEDDG